MTITTTRPATARYYAGQHYTEASFPAGEIIYHGTNAIDTGDVVLCQVTPEVHIVIDRADVEIA